MFRFAFDNVFENIYFFLEKETRIKKKKNVGYRS
jgi:hypothetical protein